MAAIQVQRNFALCVRSGVDLNLPSAGPVTLTGTIPSAAIREHGVHRDGSLGPACHDP